MPVQDMMKQKAMAIKKTRMRAFTLEFLANRQLCIHPGGISSINISSSSAADHDSMPMSRVCNFPGCDEAKGNGD